MPGPRGAGGRGLAPDRLRASPKAVRRAFLPAEDPECASFIASLIVQIGSRVLPGIRSCVDPSPCGHHPRHRIPRPPASFLWKCVAVQSRHFVPNGSGTPVTVPLRAGITKFGACFFLHHAAAKACKHELSALGTWSSLSP